MLRWVSATAVLGLWTLVYVRYRRASTGRTRLEYERLRNIDWTAFSRHYNERVPTVEEELELWGPYHKHRHHMRYQLVADQVRRLLGPTGMVLDLGCGSALIADLIADADARYVGMDFGGPQISKAAAKFCGKAQSLRTWFVRGDAAGLPFRSSRFDVVVMSEVIEHLIRPELAVWEIARVLRPGGILVMTTNNACEAPLRSPLTHLFAWLEKMLGSSIPEVVSRRPWVWPEKVDPDLLPPGSGDVYVPHTHHIPAETIELLAHAGMSTMTWSTFEFPPPHSATARWLARHGRFGIRFADAIEAVARTTPLIRRLGTHLFVVARKTSDAVASQPPPGIWTGPFSQGSARSR